MCLFPKLWFVNVLFSLLNKQKSYIILAVETSKLLDELFSSMPTKTMNV